LFVKYIQIIPKLGHIRKFKRELKIEKLLFHEFGILWSQVFWGSIFLSCTITVLLIGIFQLIAVSNIYYLLAVGLFFVIFFILIRIFPRYFREQGEEIDKNLPLIQNCLELYMSFLPEHQDVCLVIIEFLANVPSPVQKPFKKLQHEIQLGVLPENALQSYISPSSSFNTYINSLILHNFMRTGIYFQEKATLEHQYRIRSRSLESRLTIAFFLGIFIPLGFSLGVFLLKLHMIWLILPTPLLFLMLATLTKKITQDNSILLGTDITSKNEVKTEYREYLNFFHELSLNLTQMCPERALVHALETTSIRNKDEISSSLSNFKSHTLSFDILLEKIHQNIQGIKTQLIFGTMRYMLSSSNMILSQNINELLSLLRHHQELETQRLLIIKGEIFKVNVFQIILPIIFGLLSSILYMISVMIPTVAFSFFNPVSKIGVIIFLINQCVALNISIFFFRKLVGIKKFFSISVFITLLYAMVFFIGLFLYQFLSFTV
jgi:hypothetical protein